MDEGRVGRKVWFWGACLAGTALLAPFLFARVTGGFDVYRRALAAVPWTIWAAVALSTAVFYLLDYVRMVALLSMMNHRISIPAAFRLTCISYFVSSLTPSAELNVPAMTYMLARQGLDVGTAMAVSVAKSIYITLWICVVALASLHLAPDVALPPHVAGHLVLYLAPLCGLVLTLGLICAFPGRVHRLAARGAASPRVPGWLKAVLGGVDKSAQALAGIAFSTHPMHLVSHAGAIAFVLVYAWIGYLLCNGFGIPITLGRAVAVFSNGLMVAYLAPVPGSVGVTEVATNYLLDPRMTHVGMAAILTQRILCWYIVIVPGVLFLARSLNRDGLRAILAPPRAPAAPGK